MPSCSEGTLGGAQNKGRFVTFEGIEGSGKTTLINSVKNWLQKKDLEVISTREPGGSELGPKLRQLILETKPAPETELLLFAADRAEHVSKLLKPKLIQGVNILCDRFTHSSLAYQGYGRGLSLETISFLNQTATGGLKPDLVIWLDLDVEVALERAKKRGSESWTRFEKEGVEFHKSIQAGYTELQKNEPSLIKRVDASLSENIVFENTCKQLEPLFAPKK